MEPHVSAIFTRIYTLALATSASRVQYLCSIQHFRIRDTLTTRPATCCVFLVFSSGVEIVRVVAVW